MIASIGFSNISQNSFELDTINQDLNNRKRIQAFFLSAVFSGSGQLYLGEYKKGAIHSSIEIMQWIYHDKYIEESKKYTNQYKIFADENKTL